MPKEMKIAPLRPLDDFLLQTARYQLPNFSDLERWGNRVTQNFLYYQSNYFLLSALIFLIVAVIHPIEMLLGMAAIILAVAGSYYLTTQTGADRFKREHPILSAVFVATVGYLFLYMIGAVCVFLFGALLPIFVSFIHASLRMRTIKNKIVNKLEGLDILKKTPMGVFLDAFVGVSDAVEVDFETIETQLARKAKALLQDIGSKSKLH